jgi:threonylcarbamoyladenosine tRNA methylthiotransferase MtaB
MNRTYQRDVIFDAVKKLREAKPNCFIACDVIAGFPGETEKDFADTLEMCKICDFTWIHAFPFSPRPGTEAYHMKNKVPESVTKERVKKLTDFSINSKNKYLSLFLEKEISGIVEKRRFPDLRVVTDNFIHTKITNSNDFNETDLGGKRVFVKIMGICNNSSQTEAPEAYGIIEKV